MRRWLAVLLALVPLGVNLAAFVAIDPVSAFQSPYWDRLPVSNASLLQTLRDEDVTAVWMNHWAGQPLMFDARAAGQDLIAYDYYDVQAGGIDRFPEYRRAWPRQSAQHSYWSPTNPNRPCSPSYGDWESRSREHVAPYVVVIPISRYVDPSEVTSALDYRY